MRPAQLEHAIRKPGILVLVDEMQHGISRLTGA
jgi:4-aminobutyrate aminotransferase-like enzyme